MLPDWNEAAGLDVPSNLQIDGHSFRRVEVLTGSPRRRRWSTAEKMAIVAESLAPGAVTSEIALVTGCTAISFMAGAGNFASTATSLTSMRTGKAISRDRLGTGRGVGMRVDWTGLRSVSRKRRLRGSSLGCGTNT